jgi:hypothetical protein
MNTHITILEALVVSGVSLVAYAAIKAAYETWLTKH